MGFKPAALHHIPPYIAYGFFERRWTCMHCVAFVERLQRKRLLEPTSPNPERFAKLRRCGEGKGAEATQAITQFPWKPQFESTDPWLILDWLVAAKEVRNHKRVNIAADKFGKLLGRNVIGGSEYLLKNLERLQGEYLRRARPRLDIVAMLLHRAMFVIFMRSSDLFVAEPDLYLYIDASPQWKRNLELFASS